MTSSDPLHLHLLHIYFLFINQSIGIIFLEMKGKPSVVAIYEQPSAHSLSPNPPERPRQPFSFTNDKMFLEDDYDVL